MSEFIGLDVSKEETRREHSLCPERIVAAVPTGAKVSMTSRIWLQPNPNSGIASNTWRHRKPKVRT